MNVVSFSVVKTNSFAKIDLDSGEVSSALASYPDLETATRAGIFSPAIASPTDTVSFEIEGDGSASIVVISEKTTLSAAGNASS